MNNETSVKSKRVESIKIADESEGVPRGYLIKAQKDIDRGYKKFLERRGLKPETINNDMLFR